MKGYYNMNTEKNRFTLTSITWPLFIQSFLGLLIGNINVIMLSKLSDQAVGAVGIANQIIGMLNIIFTVTSMGTAILMTQYIGSNNLTMSKKVAQVSLIINTIFGTIFSLIFIFFGEALLNMMSLPAEMLPYGSIYIQIVGGASFIQSIILTLSAILRSNGNTKFPMKVTLFMGCINILGNYISLFNPFNLPTFGVQGVSISVLISNIISLIIIVYVTSKNKYVFIKIKNFSNIDIGIVKLIMKVGGPAAGEYISYSLSQLVVTYIITGLGSSIINTRIYLQNITTFVNIISFSIGQGAQIIIGYMKGAGKLNDMHKICIKSLKIAVVSNFILALIFYILGKNLISIFSSDLSILELGKNILLIDIFLEIGRGFNHVVGSCLRGSGDVRYPVIIGIFSMWAIGLFLSFLFGIHFNFGLAGIWIASLLDEWFRGLVLLRRWLSKSWEKICIIDAKA
jgi:putative MATE family efflux protein